MPSTIAKTKTGIGRQAKIWNDNGHFAVQLHSTVVYDEADGKITFNNGGWVTPTTVRYMNQAFNYRHPEMKNNKGICIHKGQMQFVEWLGVGKALYTPFVEDKLTIEVA